MSEPGRTPVTARSARGVPQRQTARTTAVSISMGILKAAFALALMAVFFILFFLTPAVAAAGALLLIFGIEALRRS